MTKERLQKLKGITTWGGVAITFSGIALNLAGGGSWQGNGLSLFGLVITCCGHWIGGAIGEHQKREKEMDHERIAELEERISIAESSLDAPHLRKIASLYADEHQDDGR